MPSFRNSVFALVAAAATAQAEHLRVVWSSGTYSAATGPKGSGGGTGYDTGFAIIRDDGEAIYQTSNPYDYSPCFQHGGRTFAIEGDCWDSQFRFHCEADFGGLPDNCAVQDADGNVLGEGEAKKNTDSIGIAISTDATCVVEFESDGGGCPVDDGNGPLSATGKEV
ncbi:hypothetical protein Q7P37_001149 [Cladosporium fusiforme]